MSVDLHDGTERDPRCRCRPVHGNADDDGICRHCRPKIEAAMEAHEEAVSVALVRLVGVVEAMRPEQQTRVLEGFVAVLADEGIADGEAAQVAEQLQAILHG